MSADLPLRDVLITILQSRPGITTEELVEEVRRRGAAAGPAAVVDELVRLRRDGMVSAEGDARYLSRLMWRLTDGRAIPRASAGQVLVATIPVLLMIDPGELSTGIVTFPEALDRLIRTASRELRIMCPFFDRYGVELLRQRENDLLRLTSIKVIADRYDRAEEMRELAATLRNMEIRYAARGGSGGRKMAGLHAKVYIADDKAAIVGSFNLTAAHLHHNLDVGILLEGGIVPTLVGLFDQLWGRLR